MNRRIFNKYLAALSSSPLLLSCQETKPEEKLTHSGNIVLSTWNNHQANKIAFNELQKEPSQLLNALELGINSVEEDPEDTSVGYGGLPDRTGKVSLDACIMDQNGNAGSVTYLHNIVNAVSVARKVLEKTPHVILSGNGAYDFAIQNGFKKADLLTENSLKKYKNWLIKSNYKPKINSERHDTIGMLVKNSKGDISGACSTSGLAYKMDGRVGDSPIIGAGLFVDNEIGAATATGMGEFILKSCSSFLVVELMRQGNSPEKACQIAVQRIRARYDISQIQVGLIAINKAGQVGAYSIQPGFNYAFSSDKNAETFEAKSLI